MSRGDAHCTGLFGNDALGALTWYRIDFKEGKTLTLFVVDIIEAHHATAVKQVIEFGRHVLYLVSNTLVHLGGRDLIRKTIVFSLGVTSFEKPSYLAS